MRLTNPTLILTAMSLTTTYAAPIDIPREALMSREDSTSNSNPTVITALQLETISPASKSCTDAPMTGECVTAQQAAPYISQSFKTYNVTSRAEQAAVISLMAFESGDFKYNRNHFPGVAGQGTRNMQSPTYNVKYAFSLPLLTSQLSHVSDEPAGILSLLLSDGEYDFGSGAWFLTTQCSDEVREALRTGSESGWASYLGECVGTSVTDARRDYWNRALTALGVDSS